VIVAWVQTRHFPKRICWVGTTAQGRVYTLRVTAITPRHARLELKRTDDGGTVADRRDGWATDMLVPEVDLDALKSDTLAWANNTVLCNP
jgi:hypothetical protein